MNMFFIRLRFSTQMELKSHFRVRKFSTYNPKYLASVPVLVQARPLLFVSIPFYTFLLIFITFPFSHGIRR